MEEDKKKYKCDCCNKEIDDYIYKYNEHEPLLSYTLCRKCFVNDNLPYYAIISLLILIDKGEIQLTTEEINNLYAKAQKLGKIKDKITQDIASCTDIYNNIFNNKKGE